MVALVGFLVLAVVLARRGVALPAGLLGGAGLGWALLAWLSPRAARPLHVAWMRLGETLGRVTTPALLVAVFVLVVIPTRLFLALRGLDPLQRRFDRAASSYWHARDAAAPGREGFERPW